MELVLQMCGVLLIGLVLADIFLVVLFPASGKGLIQRPLAAGVWAAFGSVAARLEAQSSRNLLSYTGPLIIALNLAVWFAILVVGWAMIFKPVLGAAITASSGPTDTSWTTALYYSGFNITTLGVGDVTPSTGLYRVLTVLQGAMGFGFFSLTISYFLSVYPNLKERNALALGLYHLAGQSCDTKRLITRLAKADDLSQVVSSLGSKFPDLCAIYEAQRFYPVLRYFHYREPYYALPYFLFILLDTTSLLRSVLDPEHHREVVTAPVLEDICQVALGLGNATLVSTTHPELSPDAREDWQQHYLKAHGQLADAGLSVRPDPSEGVRQYAEMRARWAPMLDALSRHMAGADTRDL